MKILAIDTSTKYLSLGLYDGAKLYEYNLELGRKMSSLLAPTLERALGALGWRLKDIDYFACGLGPGSFTGMRVGLATIKGLVWALKKPVVAGIPTLDTLALNAKGSRAAYIMPAVDAKRNLIYCSIYAEKNGRLKRITPYMLLNEKEFLRKIKPQSVILGDALNLYKEKILKNNKSVTLLDKDYWQLEARNIITLALRQIKEKKLRRSFQIKPIYLYPKECQIKK